MIFSRRSLRYGPACVDRSLNVFLCGAGFSRRLKPAPHCLIKLWLQVCGVAALCYKTYMRILCGVAVLVSFSLSLAAANLRIYFVDVEGGAATLIVAPSGESMLVDTGNPLPDDRDAKRIYAAAQQAGLKKIDNLFTTHFDGDHSGGVASLVKMIPIAKFYDHGDTTEAEKPRDVERWNAYKAAAATGRRTSEIGRAHV